jgi:hypothetical protein
MVGQLNTLSQRYEKLVEQYKAEVATRVELSEELSLTEKLLDVTTELCAGLRAQVDTYKESTSIVSATANVNRTRADLAQGHAIELARENEKLLGKIDKLSFSMYTYETLAAYPNFKLEHIADTIAQVMLERNYYPEWDDNSGTLSFAEIE